MGSWGAIPLPLLLPHGGCWVAHSMGEAASRCWWHHIPQGDIYQEGRGPKAGGESRILKYLQISKLVLYALASINGSWLLWTWRLTSVLATLWTLAREKWSMGSHLSRINKHLTNDHVCQTPWTWGWIRFLWFLSAAGCFEAAAGCCFGYSLFHFYLPSLGAWDFAQALAFLVAVPLRAFCLKEAQKWRRRHDFGSSRDYFFYH